VPRKAPTAHQLLQALRKNKELEKEMVSHEVPTKRHNKNVVSRKLTKNTRSSFNAEALRGVPGASQYGGFLQQIHAEETGTRVATPEQLQRLTRSPQNCYTTKTLHTYSYLTGVNAEVNITPKYDPRTGKRW
jgi:hypothetical protein